MRILQVNKFNYLRGGAEKYFIEFSQELEKAGHEVAIFSMHHPKNNSSIWDKYFVSRISFEKINWRSVFLSPFRILYSLEARRKFKKIIKDFKPDIIHLHNIYHQISPSILPIAKKNNIPVVMHLHDYKLICPNYQLFVNGEICYRCRGGKYYNCLKYRCFKGSWWQSFLATIEMYLHHKILNIYLKNINYFIAPSDFMRKTVISFGVPAEKVGLVYNFVSSPSEDHQEGIAAGDYGLYFGRLSAEKGIDILLKAVKLSSSGLKIKIVGSGPEEQNLKQISTDLSLEEQVEFLGYKSGQELQDLITSSKVIFLPSVWAENMPFSLLEALSAGKVVVASETGGLPELIVDEETGFLFKKGDEHDLAKKIDNLDNFNLKEIGKKAQHKIKGFNIKNHLNSIINIYKKYVKNN